MSKKKINDPKFYEIYIRDRNQNSTDLDNPVNVPAIPGPESELEDFAVWAEELYQFEKLDDAIAEEELQAIYDAFANHGETLDTGFTQSEDEQANDRFDNATDKNKPKGSDSFVSQMERGQQAAKIPEHSGLFQTDGPEPKISFRSAPGEKILKKGNAYICLGKDRPSTLPSGYGGKGALGSSAIDLVVGRMSSLPLVNTRRKRTIVNNHFGADAARIHISQLTDIDTNFGIDDGMTGNILARSGVGIKADVVRVIGREGIKIVTGKAAFPGFGPGGEPNSRGGRIIQPAPKIELIAGNSSEPRTVAGNEYVKQQTINMLQPVIAGDNLSDGLIELTNIIEKIMSAVFNLAIIQTAFNSAIGVNIFPANSAHYAAAGGGSAAQILDTVVANIWQTRINTALWEVNYCHPVGYKYICSRNVYAT